MGQLSTTKKESQTSIVEKEEWMAVQMPSHRGNPLCLMQII